MGCILFKLCEVHLCQNDVFKDEQSQHASLSRPLNFTEVVDNEQLSRVRPTGFC